MRLRRRQVWSRCGDFVFPSTSSNILGCRDRFGLSGCSLSCLRVCYLIRSQSHSSHIYCMHLACLPSVAFLKSAHLKSFTMRVPAPFLFTCPCHLNLLSAIFFASSAVHHWSHFSPLLHTSTSTYHSYVALFVVFCCFTCLHSAIYL